MNNEDIKQLFKDNSILIIIIMLACVVLIGSSYAWYKVSIDSSKTTTIVAGNLELSLEEKNEITLANAIPQSDANGMQSESFNFKVTNTGTVDSKFKIYLDDAPLSSGTRISDSVLKYSVTGGSTSTGAKYMNSNYVGSRREVATGTLRAGESAEYQLRVWIAEEATTEVSGQQFLAKVGIEGGQLNEE